MSTLWMIFLIVFGLLRRSFGRAGAGLGSRIGRRPTAKRPKVLDANPVRGMLLAAERGCWRRRGAVGGASRRWECRLLQGRIPGVGQVIDLSVIPSPPDGGMEFGATVRSAGSIRGGDLASNGGS
jgi:hypothetical protein